MPQFEFHFVCILILVISFTVSIEIRGLNKITPENLPSTVSVPYTYPTVVYGTTEELSCDSSNSCPVEMICYENSQCRCKDELYTRLDETINRCRLIAGTPCVSDTSDNRYVPCTRGSSCSGGICTCAPGSRVSLRGFCKLDHGEACTNSYEDSTNGPLCNDESFLRCLNETCACRSEEYMTWDPLKLKCVAKSGVACGFNDDSEENFVVECETNHECYERPGMAYRICTPLSIPSF